MSSSYVDIDSQSQIKNVALQLSLGERDVSAVVQLLDSGATVPFIARYRKEATGNQDEVAIARIRDLIIRLRQVDERRQAIISSLGKRDLLTEDLLEKLLAAESLARLEDIYLPFRPKRKTRASAARERGLEPLARMIFDQPKAGLDPEEEATAFVDPAKGLDSPLEALAGARDIMAEWMSEDAEVRAKMRVIYQTQGVLRSQPAKGSHADESGKYRDYLDLSLPISQVSPHRLLAMLRGARDGALSLHLAPLDEDGLAALEEQFIKGDGPATEQVMLAAEDGYRRLLAPSMENEVMMGRMDLRRLLKKK